MNEMDALTRDFKLALRGLSKRPGLSLAAAITLVLGVGANIAIFSVVYGVLFRPLGFSPERPLVSVLATNQNEGQERIGSSLSDYRFLERHQRSFDRVGFFGWSSMTLERPEGAQQLVGVFTDPELFTTLGVEPMLGRSYGVEDAAGLGSAALISEAAWRRIWGADPDLVGTTLRIDGRPVEVAGVLPAGTELPSPFAEIWVPVGPGVQETARFGRDERDFVIVGQLAPGITAGEAERDVAALAQRLSEEFPDTNGGWGWTAKPLRDHLMGGAEGPVWIAFAAVALVLLLACANITHLLLVRTAGRRREMSVRSALGASRSDLARLVLMESLVLAFAGGLFGTVAAVWLHDLMLALDPGVLPRHASFAIDAPVLAFAFFMSLLTGVLCGVLPAVYGTGAAPLGRGESLASRGQAAGAGGGWRRALLGFEVALSLVLLAAAGLLGRTLYDLHRVDPGFSPEQTYMSYFLLDGSEYDGNEARVQYFARLQEAVAAIPGVEAAALSTSPPVPDTGIVIDVPYRAEGEAPLEDGKGRRAAFRIVTPGYFETVGMPLKAGRDFDDADVAAGRPVVVVNQALAGRLWGSESRALGQRMEIEFEGLTLPLEVTGVVGDTRFAGLHQSPSPALFLPHAQLPFRGMAVAARTALAPEIYARALRQVAAGLDAQVAPADVFSLQERLERTYGLERFFAVLLGVFAAVALALTAGGIYGVFSFWVSERTREIGVRMALGAARRQVVTLVVSQGASVAILGVLVGGVGAVLAAQLIRSHFAGVPAAGILGLGALALALLAVTALACLGPALRASRIEPTAALGAE